MKQKHVERNKPSMHNKNGRQLGTKMVLKRKHKLHFESMSGGQRAARMDKLRKVQETDCHNNANLLTEKH